MQHQQHHYNSILNDHSKLSKTNQKQLLSQSYIFKSEYKQSYSRKLFKSLFCIGTSCKSEDLIDLAEKVNFSVQTVTSEQPQRQPKAKAKLRSINDFDQAILNSSSDIYLLSNNDYQVDINYFLFILQTLPALMVLSNVQLFTTKKQSEDVCNGSIFRSETQLEKFCRYLQTKHQNKNIMICQLEPCAKLIQSFQTSCNYILVNIDEYHQAHQSFNYIMQQQKSIFKQAEKQNSNIVNPEYVLTSYPKFSDLGQFDTILIIPYLKCSCYTPEIQQQLLRQYVEKQLKEIYNSYPQVMENVVLILPSSFPFEELQEMFILENNAFFGFYENPTWFSRVRNINEYTYIMQRRWMGSNQNSNSKNQQIKSRNYYQKIQINSAGKEFNFNCLLFERYVKLKGVYIDDKLEYYIIKFTTIKQENQKKHKLIKWLTEEIFFIDEIQKLTNITHYFEFLDNLIKQASFMSCLQCINCIYQDQINLQSLNNQIIHLRYFSVLISSGVLQNEKDLTILQQIFYEVGMIPILDILIKEVINNKMSIQSSQKDLQNFQKHESSEFQGYSYDLSNEEKLSFVEQVMRTSEFVMTEMVQNKGQNRQRIFTDLDMEDQQSDLAIHCQLNSSVNENLSVK